MWQKLETIWNRKRGKGEGRKARKSFYRLRPLPSRKPWKLRLSELATKKLLGYQLAGQSFEVGGFLLLEEIPLLDDRELTFDVKDITLLGSGFASVLASSKKVALHFAALVEAGQEPERIKGLWHSHPGFAPSWSGADESGIRKLLHTAGLGSTNPWILSLCASGAWINSRLDWMADGQQFMSTLELTDLPGLDLFWLQEVEKAIEIENAQTIQAYRSRFPLYPEIPEWPLETTEREPFEMLPKETLESGRKYCPFQGRKVELHLCEECPLQLDCIDWL